MLATIRDDTRNALDIQHIIPNSKRWDYYTDRSYKRTIRLLNRYRSVFHAFDVSGDLSKLSQYIMFGFTHRNANHCLSSDHCHIDRIHFLFAVRLCQENDWDCHSILFCVHCGHVLVSFSTHLPRFWNWNERCMSSNRTDGSWWLRHLEGILTRHGGWDGIITWHGGLATHTGCSGYGRARWKYTQDTPRFHKGPPLMGIYKEKNMKSASNNSFLGQKKIWLLAYAVQHTLWTLNWCQMPNFAT